MGNREVVGGSRSLGETFRVHPVPSLVLISTSAPHFLTASERLLASTACIRVYRVVELNRVPEL